jgi:four helix bundle protein
VKAARAASRSAKHIESYKDLRVYLMAFDAAMSIFELTKGFPAEERYSLVDQIRRSSRSVCANIAEAWRKRRYEAHFVSKLSDAESEAEETRVWLDFAKRCGYLSVEAASELDNVYHRVLGQLVTMISSAARWAVRS